MAILKHIDGIPLYSTTQEALQYASSNGLTGYHTHVYNEPKAVGYAGGAAYRTITGYMGGPTHYKTTAVNTKKRISSTRIGGEIVRVDPFNPDESFFVDGAGANKIIRVVGDSGAIFTLTITNIDGNSILENSLNNVVIPQSGVYSFLQRFPKLTKTSDGSLSSNRYDVSIFPGVNTVFSGTVPDKYSIYQYTSPKITFTKSTSTTGSTNPQTLTLTGDDVVVSGGVLKRASGGATTTVEKWNKDRMNYVRETTVLASKKQIDWTVATAAAFKGFLFVTRQPLISDFTTGSTYTKTTKKSVIDSKNLPIRPNTNDLKIGMSLNAEISITKIVKSTVDPKIVDKINRYTIHGTSDTFKLPNLDDLILGMSVNKTSILGTKIHLGIITNLNLDDNSFTTSKEVVIKEGTELIFSYSYINEIESVDNLFNITLVNPITIASRVTLTFVNDKSNIIPDLRVTGSGDRFLKISGDIDVVNFGKENATYTLNVDNFISNSPNAYDQNVLVTKNTATVINMVKNDPDETIVIGTAGFKIATVVSGPSNGTLGSYHIVNNTFTYTPTTGFVGKDRFEYYFTVYDDGGDDAGSPASANKTIYITVE